MHCLSIILSLSFVVTTSSQGCPDGWRPSEVIPNKCYYVAALKKIWFEAEAFCKNAQPNAHLTSIASAYENFNVDAVVTSTSSVSVCDQFWTGANDFDQSGQFVWVDGSPWGYHNWALGQPDATQHCVSSTARTNGQWRTEPCGNENCFICEIFVGGSTPLPPTTIPLTTSAAAPTNMTDCKDWFNHGGAHTDGIYSINPDGRGKFNVFCDMTTDGGGWTVIQRRIDGNLSFYDKSWEDYKVGFTDGLDKNLWLGNDIIHVLSTKDSNVELRIDLWGDQKPNSRYANIYLWEKHANFAIDDEAHFYRLHLYRLDAGNATTSLGNSIGHSNGFNFSTVDANHGANTECFYYRQLGGWWLSYDCAQVALNGEYVPSSWGYGFGFFWDGASYYINPKQSRLMLRSSL
uniref:Uncharacterized protein n=1 Tax=Plectus sambesii TaxID=2011161 RepID=A0A914W9D2_9BILA